MGKKIEGGSGYRKLRSKKSLKRILEVAARFERSARDFYTDLIPKVGKNIRYLVEELAEEEQQHFDLFTRLAQNPEIVRLIRTEIETPVSDHKFSDCIHLPDLGESPDDQSVLQYAVMREHAAMEQYRALAENAEAGPIRDLFTFLANEETRHKNELEKIYYETVHSGGV